MTAPRTRGGAAPARAPLRRPPAGRPLRVKMISPAKTAARQPLLAPHQVLAVPAARPGHAGRLPGPGRRGRRCRTSTSSRCASTTSPTWSSSRSTSPPPSAPTAIADHYRARGAYVVLGGLHVDLAAGRGRAATPTAIFLGPGEDTWPAFLRRLPRRPARRPRLPLDRCARSPALPPVRRDLIKRHRYLVPNSIVVSRGCPHVCDFCYKEAFFAGRHGRSTRRRWTTRWPRSTACPAGTSTSSTTTCSATRRFAAALFDGMRGMGRLWQAAGTVQGGARARPARAGGRRAGCAACSSASRRSTRRTCARSSASCQNLGPRLRRRHPPPARPGRDGQRQLRLRHGRRRPDGVRAHGGVGGEPGHRDGDVPHHDAVPRHRARAAHGGRGRVTSTRLGPLRHAPRRLHAGRHDAGAARGRLLARVPRVLPLGHIWRAACAHGDLREHARHLAYTGGWKKLEPMWDWAIRSGQVHRFLPLLEAILDRFGSGGGAMPARLGGGLRPPRSPAGRTSRRSLRADRRHCGRTTACAGATQPERTHPPGAPRSSSGRVAGRPHTQSGATVDIRVHSTCVCSH